MITILDNNSGGAKASGGGFASLITPENINSAVGIFNGLTQNSATPGTAITAKPVVTNPSFNLSLAGTGQGATAVDPLATVNSNISYSNDTPVKKDNTLTYVLIGVGVLVVGVILYFVIKK